MYSYYIMNCAKIWLLHCSVWRHSLYAAEVEQPLKQLCNVGALIISIGFWGPTIP